MNTAILITHLKESQPKKLSIDHNHTQKKEQNKKEREKRD